MIRKGFKTRRQDLNEAKKNNNTAHCKKFTHRKAVKSEKNKIFLFIIKKCKKIIKIAQESTFRL